MHHLVSLRFLKTQRHLKADEVFAYMITHHFSSPTSFDSKNFFSPVFVTDDHLSSPDVHPAPLQP